jgi:hypothetical protein
MNRDEVIDVLTAVAAADRRTVGHADVDVWQAVIGDIPKDFALQAVRDHLREQPGVWLEPGHVYQRSRVFMRDQLEREPTELREARQAMLDAKAAADAAEREHWAGPLKHLRPRVNSLMLPCPHCHAGSGARCVVPGTNRPPHGGTHPARIAQAHNAKAEANA